MLYPEMTKIENKQTAKDVTNRYLKTKNASICFIV